MPATDAPIQVMVELECSCGHVWETEACDHMGALDIYDSDCPSCGDEDEKKVVEVLG